MALYLRGEFFRVGGWLWVPLTGDPETAANALLEAWRFDAPNYPPDTDPTGDTLPATAGSEYLLACVRWGNRGPRDPATGRFTFDEFGVVFPPFGEPVASGEDDLWDKPILRAEVNYCSGVVFTYSPSTTPPKLLVTHGWRVVGPTAMADDSFSAHASMSVYRVYEYNPSSLAPIDEEYMGDQSVSATVYQIPPAPLRGRDWTEYLVSGLYRAIADPFEPLDTTVVAACQLQRARGYGVIDDSGPGATIWDLDAYGFVAWENYFLHSSGSPDPMLHPGILSGFTGDMIPGTFACNAFRWVGAGGLWGPVFSYRVERSPGGGVTNSTGGCVPPEDRPRPVPVVDTSVQTVILWLIAALLAIIAAVVTVAAIVPLLELLTVVIPAAILAEGRLILQQIGVIAPQPTLLPAATQEALQTAGAAYDSMLSAEQELEALETRAGLGETIGVEELTMAQQRYIQAGEQLQTAEIALAKAR